MSEAKFMRIIVFFDLPVTGGQAQSRQSIPPVPLKDGYQMLQPSVYSRIVKVEIRCKNTTIGYVQTYRKKAQSAVWK